MNLHQDELVSKDSKPGSQNRLKSRLRVVCGSFFTWDGARHIWAGRRGSGEPGCCWDRSRAEIARITYHSHMALRLFDTYTRRVRDFEPLQPSAAGAVPQVRMYTCGPTVYDYAHIGNLRTYIFEDILRRVLEFDGYSVKHVMNIT